MRPRLTFSSINNAVQLSLHLQYADLAMNKIFINATLKVVNAKRSQYPQLSRYFLEILSIYNNAFYPHSLFKNVYKEPKSLERIKLFLSLLQELPAELNCLKHSPANFFESTLKNLLNFTSMFNALSALTGTKIREIMARNPKYQELPNDLQNSFVAILFNLKYQMEFDCQRLFQQSNRPERFGMTVDQALAITQELDKALQGEFSVLMMNYLTYMVAYYQDLPPPNQNAAAFEIIFLEVKNKKSPLAFYNMQLGYPLDRPLLMGVLEKGFQPQIDRGLNIDESKRTHYFITQLAKFYPEFPDAHLTKASAVLGANNILREIHASNCLIEEKLIHFQVLFALSQYYANTHTSPDIDNLFGIDNTQTWQQLMSTIRAAAYFELKNDRNYILPRAASHDLSVLKAAVKLPLFNQR